MRSPPQWTEFYMFPEHQRSHHLGDCRWLSGASGNCQCRLVCPITPLSSHLCLLWRCRPGRNYKLAAPHLESKKGDRLIQVWEKNRLLLSYFTYILDLSREIKFHHNEEHCSTTIITPHVYVEAWWPHGQCARARIEWSVFRPWAGTLCCVLGQDTLLWQYLSPLWCIKKYQRI